MAKKKMTMKAQTVEVSAKEVLAATAPPVLKGPSKKELAQEALDLLGSATPSVAYDDKTVRWLDEGAYNAIEGRLSAIING